MLQTDMGNATSGLWSIVKGALGFVKKDASAKPSASLQSQQSQQPQNGMWRESQSEQSERGDQVKILKKGSAMRVIFFYPGEEGTYVDNAHVTLYENGIVQIKSAQEETTTHLQNCEILWSFELDAAEDKSNKVRLLKPKGELRSADESLELKSEGKPPKGTEPTKTL